MMTVEATSWLCLKQVFRKNDMSGLIRVEREMFRFIKATFEKDGMVRTACQ